MADVILSKRQKKEGRAPIRGAPTRCRQLCAVPSLFDTFSLWPAVPPHICLPTFDWAEWRLGFKLIQAGCDLVSLGFEVFEFVAFALDYVLGGLGDEVFVVE